jgi:D-alanyl-lipoteichoic acid acyltransferase DltB (MBOAT superfamily)
MLFNSIEFAIFLPIVFVLYWFIANKNLKVQNLLLVIASYVFYGWWDWRFLSLIVFSSLIDYFIGVELFKQNDRQKRKILLFISLGINLGLLGFFKYFNFFVDNFIDAFSLFGQQLDKTTLSILLPVGISFYTFQTLSYSIDVYRRKIEPTKNIIAFFAYVSFFPQLVAGPIERATSLLPQFYKKRNFDSHKAIDGMRQILWGLFKKIVVADNCAKFANDIFSGHLENDTSGAILLLGAIFFAFQIYGDFSGYSDIAIGTARLFGFNLMQNFAFPYFSRDIAEFWRRWHISLSTWFRDYVYIPLGGSQGSTKTKIRNIFIIFIVSGFWHGANWTFIAWGALNAIYFLPLMLLNKNRSHTNLVAEGKLIPSLKECLQMGITFFLTVIAWVFFRANTILEAFTYIYDLIIGLIQEPNVFLSLQFWSSYIKGIAFIFLLLITEWLQRDKQHALDFTNKKTPIIIRWVIYYTIIILIYLFVGHQQTFIYFQF